MTTDHAAFPRLLLAALLAAFLAAPAAAEDPRPADLDFILRAPAAEIDGIATRNDLTVISQVATAVDEDGHSLYLVRAAAGALPEQVLEQVRSLEPEAAGIEEAVLARLPKLDQSTAVILDTSAVDSALGAIDGFSPPSATISATWNGHLHDREIEAGKTEKLEFEFELPVTPTALLYSLEVTFSDGSTAGPVAGSWAFSGEKVEVEVTNPDPEDKIVDVVTLGWPAENGKLLTGKLHGDNLLDAPYDKFGEDALGEDRQVWTGYLNQPATARLGLDKAQESFRGEATVAIIDTGIDPDHPLLADRVVPGYDFVNDVAGSASELGDLDQSTAVILDQSTAVILDQSTAVILDQSTAVILDQSTAVILDINDIPPAYGHGTMVAGIIHRVAPEARLMPLKAFDAYGHAHLYDIVDAIYFAVDNGANVIHMSFSLETYSPELMRAINYAARNGVACVASAGNNGEEVLVFPAAFGNTIGVASTDDDDFLSAFSNWGSDLVTISAPGENIVSTYPGSRWAVASGTSFAAPWISGAAALFADKLGKKHAPGKADFYLSSNALADADPVAGSGAGRSGYGRANLEKAMERIRSGRYAADRPLGSYTISASFTEGCTASYPPPSSGSGCTAEGGSQLKFDGQKVIWQVSSGSESNLTLQSLDIVWEADNGDLKKVKIDGTTVHDTLLPPTSATVASGWLDGIEARTWAPHEARELVFEFDHDVVWTY